MKSSPSIGEDQQSGWSCERSHLQEAQCHLEVRKIAVRDVPDLIKTALNMQTFALGPRSFRQHRGSPVGSPLSPALCLMECISEQSWSINFKEALTNHNLLFGIFDMWTAGWFLVTNSFRTWLRMESCLMKVSMASPSFGRLNLTRSSWASWLRQIPLH